MKKVWQIIDEKEFEEYTKTENRENKETCMVKDKEEREDNLKRKSRCALVTLKLLFIKLS